MKKLFLSLVLLCVCLGTTLAQKFAYQCTFTGTPSTEWVTGQHWKFTDADGALFYARFIGGTDTLTSSFIDIKELDFVPSVKMSFKNEANMRFVNTIKVYCRDADNVPFNEIWSCSEVMDSAKFALPERFGSELYNKVQLQIVVSYSGGAKTAIKFLSVENGFKQKPQNISIKPSVNGVYFEYQNYFNAYNANYVNIIISENEITDFTTGGHVIDLSQITDPSYEVAAGTLQPKTQYHLYMQGNFGSEGFSDWYDTTFTTEDFIHSFPYTLDFESTVDPNITFIRSANFGATSIRDSIAEAIKIKSDTIRAYQGKKFFHFSENSGKSAYIILPAIKENIKDYQLRFFARRTHVDSTAQLIIGLVKNSDPTQSFDEIKTIKLDDVKAWEECTFQFNNYTGTNARIAIRAYNPSSNNSVLIDNITVEAKTPCPKIALLQCAHVTEKGATLEWLDESQNSEWNLCVTSTHYSNPNNIPQGNIVSISNNPYVYEKAENTPDTKYYVYLQPSCGGVWQCDSFVTKRVLTCPYVDNFGSYDAKLYNTSTSGGSELPDQWVRGAINVSTGAAATGTAYLANLCSSANHNEQLGPNDNAQGCIRTSVTSTILSYFIMSRLDCANNMSSYQLRYFLRKGSSDVDLEVYVGFAKELTPDLTPAEQLATNIHFIDTQIVKLTDATKWEEMRASFKNYQPEYGNYLVMAFKEVSTSTNTSSRYFYIDDMEIGEAVDGCYPVHLFSIAKRDTASIVLSWTEADKATQWQVKVSNTNDFDPTSNNPIIAAGNVYDQTVNATQVVVTNTSLVNSGDTLYAAVSPVCGSNRVWSSVLSIPTTAAISIPYTNNFGNETASKLDFPKGWITANGMTPTRTITYVPYVKNSSWSNADDMFINTEKNRLIIPTSSSYKDYFEPYAILPAVRNEAFSNLQMSFYVYSTSIMKLNVGVVETVDKGIDNVQLIKQIQIKEKSIPELVYVDLASYTGSGRYIVLYTDSNSGVSLQIEVDNLSIERKDALWQVTNVAISDVQKNSMKVNWTENGTATKWRVRVLLKKQASVQAIDTAHRADNTVFSKDVLVNSGVKECSIPGLNAGTCYYIYVQPFSVNGSNDTTFGPWSSVVSEYTQCDKVTVPYTFDHSKEIDPCFDIYPATYAPSRPSGDKAAWGVIGNRVLRLHANSSNPVVRVAFPEMDADISTLQLYVEADDYLSYLDDKTLTKIGVLTNDGVFHVVDSFSIKEKDHLVKSEISFASCVGLSGRIAVQMESNDGSYHYIDLDNFRIEYLPDCKKPKHIHETALDSSKVTLAWDAADNNTPSWDLALTTLKTDSVDTITGIDIKHTSDLYYTFENLTENTSYYAYIRSHKTTPDCVSEWEMFAFRTHCKALPLPYYEDFTSYFEVSGNILPDEYLRVGDITSNTVSYIRKNASVTASNPGIPTEPYLYVGQGQKGKNNYCILPLVRCTDVRDLQLRMRVYPQNGSTASVYTSGSIYSTASFFEIGVLTNPYDLESFTSIYADSITNIPEVVNFKDIVCDFKNYRGFRGKYGKYIAIKVKENITSSGADLTGYISLDNISITQYSECTSPLTIKTTDASDKAITISWTGASTNSYQVRLYSPYDSVVNPNNTTATPIVDTIVTNATTVTIEGLNPNTYFTPFVRTQCGNNQYSIWNVGQTFNTLKGLVTLPYTETFDYVDVSKVPAAWTDYKTIKSEVEATSVAYIDADKKNLGKVLKLTYNTDISKCAIAIGPMLTINNIENVVLYFDVITKDVYNYSPILELGLVSKIDPEVPLKPLCEIAIKNKSNATSKYGRRLSDYAPFMTDYMTLYFKSMIQTTYLDNVYITTTAEPLKVLPVNFLTASNPTTTTISISFEEGTSWVNQWEVACVEHGTQPQSPTTINNTEYTFTGLAPNTSYDIYVRGKYNSTVGEQWTKVENIQTLPAVVTNVPYATNFEDDNDNAKWIFDQRQKNDNKAPDRFIIGDATQCNGSGSKALFVSTDGSNYRYTNEVNLSCRAYRLLHFNKGFYKFSVRAKDPNFSLNTGTEQTSKDYFSGSLTLVPNGSVYNSQSGDAIVRTPNGTTFDLIKESANNPAQGCYKVYPHIYSNPVSYPDEWIDKVIYVYVEKDGDYQLNFTWRNNTSYNRSTDVHTWQPIAVDSVSIEPVVLDSCAKPTDLTITNIDSITASFSFRANNTIKYALHKTTASIAQPFSPSSTTIVTSGTADNDNTITIENLIPCTDYILYIQCNNEADNKSTTRANISFKTACEKQSVPYENYFSSPEFKASSKYKGCFVTNGSRSTKLMNVDGVSYTVPKANNGDTSKYNFVIELAAITGANPEYKTLILPEFDANLQELTLEVGMSSYYSTKPLPQIGVIEDPENYRSFTPLKLISMKEVPGTSSGDECKMERFVCKFDNYTGAGKRIAIRNSKTSSSSTTASLLVNYVRVYTDACPLIEEVQVDDVQKNSAVLTWLKGASETTWQVKLIKDTIETILPVNASNSNVTVNGKVVSYQLADLDQSTTYVVCVRSYCSASDTGSWSTSSTFTTSCEVEQMPYVNNFSGLKYVGGSNRTQPQLAMSCWQNLVTSQMIESVFAGTAVPEKPASNVYYAYLWTVDWLTALDKDNKILSSNSYSDSYGKLNHWLVSPSISLASSSNDDIYLTFNARYCDNVGNKPHTSSDRFFVAISTDDGKTWRRDNAFELDLRSTITTKMTIQKVNLTKFKNQTIKFAFYHEANTTSLKTNYLVIDDVNINSAIVSNKDASSCFGYDYKENGFDIPADMLPSYGKTGEYTKIVKANNLSSPDTIVILHLTTSDLTEGTYYDTLCANVCTLGNVTFEYGLLNANVPYATYLVNAAGCDSLVYLYLSNPVPDTVEYEVNVPNVPFVFDEYLTVEQLPAPNTIVTIDTTSNDKNECGVNIVRRYLVKLGTGINDTYSNIVKIELYDCLGRLMSTSERNIINTKLLPAGVYTQRIYFSNGTTRNRSILVK